MAKLTIADDEEALARAAAERITTSIEHSNAARGSAIVCLTGGSTPRRLYTLLGDDSHPWRNRIDWARLHLFWGDERHVPPDHRDSNFGMAAAALLGCVPVPPSHVHRMRGELADATDAARDYEQELRSGFAAAGRSDITFDIMLLGLGEDAHVASIFPESELLRRPVKGRPTTGNEGRPTPRDVGRPAPGDVGRPAPGDVGRPTTGDVGRPAPGDVGRPFTGRRVAAIWEPHLDAWRITLTPAALLDARAIAIVVTGEKKAAAVHAAIEGPLDVSRWPAQLLRQAGDRVEWMLDRAAAADVRSGEGA